MKLLSVHIFEASTCGGLLDNAYFDVRFDEDDVKRFDPLCLIGSNGAGKSQFLQVLAEIFLTAWHAYSPDEEAADSNPTILFEVEYLISTENGEAVRVRLSRTADMLRNFGIQLEVLGNEGTWRLVEKGLEANFLPTLVVGYTSGENETLSLPFAVSRMKYAERVGRQAIGTDKNSHAVPDTRLMLLDYGTHLEVLIANLLLGSVELRDVLLSEPQLHELRSFRCTVQLNHRAAPNGGVQLTAELTDVLNNLMRCATCWDFDEDLETYIFDFVVDEAMREAFGAFWDDALHLYRSLHKLAMLNDLALPRYVQAAFQKDVSDRRFATRMPEPPDLDKVFRFERVAFLKSAKSQSIVDYVSLSDGEHQLIQVLGTMAMVSQPNALFILDEPESHFNPQWRVKFVEKMCSVPTLNGRRQGGTLACRQELLLTTHAPFVPSDMSRKNVLVFKKTSDGKNISMQRPEIETYGTTFDRILEHCFEVTPPISRIANSEIDALLDSKDQSKIEKAMAKFGASVEKTNLAHHLRQLQKKNKA